VLQELMAAREEGRRFVVDQPEAALTNWFPVTPPDRIRYYRFDGLQEQMKGWLESCPIPHVIMGRLAGSFGDPPSFEMAGAIPQRIELAYDIPFADFIGGADLGPYIDRPPASNDVVNLLRQHFALMAKARGLMSVEFASGETGWFFPDDLVPDNRIAFTAPDGRRIRRTVTGKFKKLRWHLCLVAKPRIWPELVYRIHGNVVLSEDGKLLDGEKTHPRRRRLTRSWWNDVWRDRLLAALRFLACDAVSGWRHGRSPWNCRFPTRRPTRPCRPRRTRTARSSRRPCSTIIPTNPKPTIMPTTRARRPHDARGSFYSRAPARIRQRAAH
jgi:hypothetical protein